MIDFDAFVSWCEKHFDDIIVTEKEVKINSPFDPNGDDRKHKLWCSPSGGKDAREDGVYHCWISGEKGTLVSLVQRFEGCSREDAIDLLGGNLSMAALQQQLELLLENGVETIEEESPATSKSLELPEGVQLITDIFFRDHRRIKAEQYLRNRKIPSDGLYLGVYGTYKDRILIPYYDSQGRLIYYNGRHLWKSDPKYLGPPKDLGIGKGDVVFMPSWPEKDAELYVTEGEIDAISLKLCGYNGAAVGGSEMTWNQIKILRNYKIVVAVDNDEAGSRALVRIADNLKANGMSHISFIRSPLGIKDWNEFLVKYNPAIVRKYISEHVKPYSGILV